MGRKNLATIYNVTAAINPSEAIANTTAYPESDIPINCSADIFVAIKDPPTANQGRELNARK